MRPSKAAMALANEGIVKCFRSAELAGLSMKALVELSKSEFEANARNRPVGYCAKARLLFGLFERGVVLWRSYGGVAVTVSLEEHVEEVTVRS